eukprot:TRINITY_DN11698_c0_g1_i1.p1 TRINITY_DN11698_c0_g1~~TRINITY_DN11698_c0_g1_i1.p1  ORF type:complete len:186 (-),score=52.02 TRINITY_DN11698_c0_g1_i1:182-739(-)
MSLKLVSHGPSVTYGPWWRGTVIGLKMQKTVVVAVDRPSFVQKLGIEVNKKAKFFAHDEHNICDLGDVVVLRQSKKISKRKNFVVHSMLAKEPGARHVRLHTEYLSTQTGLARYNVKKEEAQKQKQYDEQRLAQEAAKQSQKHDASKSSDNSESTLTESIEKLNLNSESSSPSSPKATSSASSSQ